MIISFKNIYKDNSKIPTKCGIYKITNTINNHFYIGQSSNLNSRLMEHHRHMRDTKKSRYILYKAVDKYGVENFNFEILELCEYENLSEREVFYILNLNPHYNIVKSPQLKKGYHSADEETVIKVYKLKNEGLNSVEISKIVKLSKKTVRDILHKKTYAHISEKHNLKVLDIESDDAKVIELIKQGFLNVDIRLFYPKCNNRRIKKIKDDNNLETPIYQISRKEYDKHVENIKNNKTKEFLKQYCIDNFLPLSRFCNLIKQKPVKRISEELIFKIYKLAKKNTKRKEISKILNVPFREVIEVLREDGKSKYTEFKKYNNLYIERKRNNRLNVNEKHEKIVLEVFDLYKQNVELPEIASKMNLRYGMVHKIIFNKSRYTKIKEKHNLHPFAN